MFEHGGRPPSGFVPAALKGQRCPARRSRSGLSDIRLTQWTTRRNLLYVPSRVVSFGSSPHPEPLPRISKIQPLLRSSHDCNEFAPPHSAPVAGNNQRHWRVWRRRNRNLGAPKPSDSRRNQMRSRGYDERDHADERSHLNSRCVYFDFYTATRSRYSPNVCSYLNQGCARLCIRCHDQDCIGELSHIEQWTMVQLVAEIQTLPHFCHRLMNPTSMMSSKQLILE